MSTPVWVWFAVIGLIVVMLGVDLLAHRRAHVIGVREAAAWSAAWVAAGVAFGVLVWQVWGADRGGEYFAGYLIEKSLAVDNVFIWAILLTYFAVPREYQHRVLFLGVVGALVFRGAFVAAGAVLIEHVAWVLYLFGAFLLITGYRMLRARSEHVDPTRSRTLRTFRRWVPMTDAYHGQRFVVRRGGVLLATPLLAVLVLVEVTDIIFAVDSIPAIFGLTQETYLVFAANAFSLLGLRQLYFLVDGLLDRLVYLSYGLAAILGFIGVKLVLHALHTNELPFVNGGEHVAVPEIPTAASLVVIVAILAVTTAASLRRTRRDGRTRTEATIAAEAAPAAQEDTVR